MNSKQFLLTSLLAIISAFLGGTFGVWSLMPPSVLAQDEPQKVITAERLEIVDENGAKRIIAEAGGIALVDENGKGRLVVEEAGFHVYDEQQNRRIALGLGTDGAALNFLNARGEKDLALAVTDDSVTLNMLAGVVVLGGGKGLKAGAGLSFGDEEGNKRLVIVMVKSAPPMISILDENEKLVWSAP